MAEYLGADVSLYLLMAMRLVDAAEDLRAMEAGPLHYRFLGWLRHPGRRIPPGNPERGRNQRGW